MSDACNHAEKWSSSGASRYEGKTRDPIDSVQLRQLRRRQAPSTELLRFISKTIRYSVFGERCHTYVHSGSRRICACHWQACLVTNINGGVTALKYATNVFRAEKSHEV